MTDQDALLPDAHPSQEAKGCIERTMTPKFIVGLWTIMNFWTYYDRGAIASALSNVRSDPVIDGSGGTISDAKGGAIVSAFMVGFFLTCPMFAALGGTFSAKQIITAGLTVWCLACLATAFSQSYWMIVIARCFVGVGEAAYAGYTVTIIDNIAPKHSRTMWIGTYYSMIPVGTAIGMLGGGLISAKTNLGSSVPGWRLVFLTEVLPMLPVVGLMLLLPTKYNPTKSQTARPPPSTPRLPNNSSASDVSYVDTTAILPPVPSSGDLAAADDPEALRKEAEVVAALRAEADDHHGGFTPRGCRRDEAALDPHISLGTALRLLVRNVAYMLLVGGYAMYTFVLGAVAVWGISFLEQGPLNLSPAAAASLMGGVTALTGLVGSIMGGVFVDRRVGGSSGLVGVLHCAKFNALLVGTAIPLGVVGLLAESVWLFAICFSVGVLLLFAVTAPATAAMLSSVPRPLRTYAVSFSVFAIHMFGDFPSPILAGKVADAFGAACMRLTEAGEAHCRGSATSCRWIPQKGIENPSCVDVFQLRNALLLTWSFLLLAVPAWVTVAWRSSRKLKEALNDPSEYEG